MADNREIIIDMLMNILNGRAKEKTVRQYVDNYLKIMKTVGEPLTKEKLTTFLENKKPSTAHQYLWGVKSVLDLNKTRNAELLEFINKRIEDGRAVIKEYYSEQKKSQRESQNWMTLKELQKYNKQQRVSLSATSNKFSKTPNPRHLRDWLLTSLYVIDPINNPPRRADYNVKITPSYHLADEDKEHNHLVILNKSKKVFVFHKYKTDKTYGTQQIPVGRKLNAVINIYLKFNPNNKYLFQDKNGENISQNNLQKNITIAFAGTGKSIGVNMLRHIVISDTVDTGDKLKVKEEMAAKMGHSVATQETYKKFD